MKTALLASLRRRYRRLVRRPTRNRCLVESLESRWLMAGDLASWYSAQMADTASLVGPVQPVGIEGTASVIEAFSAHEAEGEAAVDLVAFAQELTAAGVKFFGADWCPFCTDQKQLFGAGARYLNVIEVTNPDRTLNEIGIEEEITSFPTWQFPDSSRATGVLTLDEISERSGVEIPTGVSPSFFALEDVTLSAGSPLHLPIDAYDPNGGPLTITAVSSNPSVVMTEVPQGNRSLRITVANYGDMIFELFEDKVPRPTGRIIELVESGFYDADQQTDPIIFHRVIEDFVLHAGDPTRTGAGGSDLGQFDDQFHVDLQHNQAGVLSFAKAGDDTNDSQFFITAGPQRALDFNHSVFGQLIVGDDVRRGIDRVPTDGQDQPLRDVEIVSMSIEMDEINGLVMLKADHGVTGESDVTITVTDPDGNSHSQTIRVTVVPDTFNTAPFLDEIPPLATTVNTPLTFQLTAQDVEGDPMYFDAVLSGNTQFDFEIDHDTGWITVNPPEDFAGTLELLVGVRGATPTDSVDQFDTQLLNIEVVPTAPTSLDLLPQYDTGISDSDNLTSLKQLGVQVDGVMPGAFVSVLAGNVVVGQAIASGDSVVIDVDLTTFSDGVRELTATQQLGGMTSERSPVLEVTIDTTPPLFTSDPPTVAHVGDLLVYDAETDEEQGEAVTYSLVGAPSGVLVEPHTGIVTWTPTAAQRGDFIFTLVATDAAGNSSEQAIELNVSGDELLRYRLVTTRLDGTVEDAFAIGEEFYLQVFVADMRDDALGVFAAYLDVLFTNQLVTTAGPLEFGDQFPGDRVGELDDPTRINDAGAIAELEDSGGDEFLLFQVLLRGLAGGEEIIQSSFADNSPLRDTFVFGMTEALTENQMGFGSAVVQITAPFMAVNDLFNIDEDTSEIFDVLVNDLYPGGDVSLLRILEVGTPDKGGTVEITEDNRISYTPAQDFFGVETFTYTITDDEHGTSMATVTVQVHPVNDPPTAVDDFFTDDRAVLRNSSNNVLDLLANDTFAPDVGEVLSIIQVGPTSHGGVVTIAAGGTHVRYSPATGFTGLETFTYTISDGQGGTDTAMVTVEVTASPDDPVLEPPVARDDTGSERFIVRRDEGPHILDVLRNDFIDPASDGALTILSVTTGSANGVITIAPDRKSIRYTPASGFLGIETFQYTIGDGSGATDSATVEVEVREVVPGKISGFVYLDRNGNGQRDGNEHPLSGVEVTLQGTDDLGQQIQRSTVTGAQGQYEFADLPPGTYTVTETRPSFFAHGATPVAGSGGDTADASPSLVVELAEGMSINGSNFAELGPAAPYVGIRDLFASNHPESVLLVIHGTTHHVISAGSESWQEVQVTSARLSSDGTHWELTARDSEQNELVATVPYRESRQLQILGQNSGETLLRLYGTPELLRFQPVSGTASATEASTAPAAESSGTNEDSAGNMDAEGEASTVALTSSDSLATSLPPVVTSLGIPAPASSSSGTPAAEGESEVSGAVASHAELFANGGDLAATDLSGSGSASLEPDVLEALASQETLRPKAVQSALLSLMLASSYR
jgi:large repetitive protein